MKPEEAVEFLRDVAEVESANRADGQEDLKFRFGDQWPAEIQNSRVLESRPCLTINEVDAYCRQVENQQRQQRPRIKIHAVDNIADPKIAEVLGGITRHIEVNSDADWAYDTAFMFAATIGWGYFRMRTDFTREDSHDQDIYIDQVENPFTVYFDPNSSLPDGSDAEKVLITDLMRKEAFEKEYPSASTGGFQERATGDTDSEWVTEHDIRIAEYIYVERQKQNLIKLSDGAIFWKDQLPPEQILIDAGIRIVGDRESFRRTVKWCKTTSFEILQEKVIPGRWIPVIPVYGASYIINGRRIRLGLVRFAKDPQRMVNFWQTAITESLALAPKAKWLLAAGQDEGYDNEWALANIKTTPLLHYLARDAEGKDIPPPQRIQPEPPPQGAIEASMLASQNLQRVLGIYDPGVTQSRMHKSDKTINAEDQQTDQSNFHYYDNLTRSIKHAGRIILGWVPKVYDTQRVMRIIGDDGRPDQVTVNEKQYGEGGAIAKILNDVTVGEYNVVMDTGPGYNSKRQEAVAIFTQMLGTPLGEKIAQVADDVIVRQMDVPGADVIADRLAAANPMAQIDDKSEVPPQAQMMIKQLQDRVQKAEALLAQAAQEIKHKEGIERMKQEGETKRTLLKVTADAHDTETIAATKQHDVEARALTAQNVAEINAIAKLLVAHIGTKDLEKELEMRNKEAAAKAAEPAATLQ